MTDLADLDNGEYTTVVDSIEDELATVFFEVDRLSKRPLSEADS